MVSDTPDTTTPEILKDPDIVSLFSLGRQQQKAKVEVLEQPVAYSRFRYPVEGKGAGRLLGEQSTSEKKSFPKIRILGFSKEKYSKAVVVVSCVTHTLPLRIHPHNLVSPLKSSGNTTGSTTCSEGICTIELKNTGEEALIEFDKIGIQCLKKSEFKDSVRKRINELRVDPFKQKREKQKFVDDFDKFDSNAVKLCFQVFLMNHSGEVEDILPPLCSSTIFNSKAEDLKIIQTSDHLIPATGGKKIIVICEKLPRKEELTLRMSDPESGWEKDIQFDLYKQIVLTFRSPQFPVSLLGQPKTLLLRLIRRQDQSGSNLVEFLLESPVREDSMEPLRKRMRNSPLSETSDVSTGHVVSSSRNSTIGIPTTVGASLNENSHKSPVSSPPRESIPEHMICSSSTQEGLDGQLLDFLGRQQPAEDVDLTSELSDDISGYLDTIENIPVDVSNEDAGEEVTEFDVEFTFI